MALHVLGALLCATMLALVVHPGPTWAEGLLEAFSSRVESTYSLFSSKSTDVSGRTTKTNVNSYTETGNLGLNYNLLPKLNLDLGLNYSKNLTQPSGDGADEDTTLTRFQPFVWLTLQDPMWRASLGYSLQDEAVKTSGQPEHTLSRETYASYLHWRPTDLPSTQFRYTRTITQDGPLASVDTTEDLTSLKSEYLYRGLDASYVGTYLRTDDRIRHVVSTLLSNEGRLAYTTSFFDQRVFLTADNRVRLVELENVTQLPIPTSVGLSVLDDTPLDGALTTNPGLTDGDKTTSAGVNIGYPGPAGDFTRRNVGLDFLAPVTVSMFQVWVDGWGAAALPADITNWFSWDVYTSGDNLTWTFHATVAPAPFGPFDRRFEIGFSPVTARYVKLVTRPLPGGFIGLTDSSLYPNIFVTEVRAFVDRTAQQATQTITQLSQNYSLDVKVILFRSPSIYYRFYGQYQQFESDVQTAQSTQTRYFVSNGLYYSQPLTPILSASANGSFEIGSELDQTRTGALYYASLTATPLPTLTDSLVYSGNRQWVGPTSTESDTVGVYNTAQLYRGISTSLNLAASFTSNDDGTGSVQRRRDLFVNIGTGITPNPALTLTTYYTGKLSHSTGGPAGGARDTTQNILDLGLSLTPFRALSLAAGANILSETGQPTAVRHNYSLSWAPFPDGQLQFSFSYTESHLPEKTRSIQPALRWYLSSRRRSYLEATYLYNTTSSDSLKTQSSLFSASLKTYF